MNHHLQQVTVVDLAEPEAGKVFAETAAKLGFVQIINHGISADLIQRTWQQTQLFFDLPTEQKRKLLRSEDNALGYFDAELTKNKRDLKEILDFGGIASPFLERNERIKTEDGYNFWPESLPEFKQTLVEYYARCEILGHRILGMLCDGMGVATDTLQPHFGDRHTGFMRLNYYPLNDPLAENEAAETIPLGDMALHHHTDAGVLTILLQDSTGGLQAEIDGQWVEVTPIENALVINLGDMMQVWSNDRYRALLHRVRPVEGNSRLSIPFFLNPSYDTDITPLPAEPPKYRTINWGAFRRARSAGDYADVGKEIQIADFRIC